MELKVDFTVRISPCTFSKFCINNYGSILVKVRMYQQNGFSTARSNNEQVYIGNI